jgi:hypothetical protein
MEMLPDFYRPGNTSELSMLQMAEATDHSFVHFTPQLRSQVDLTQPSHSQHVPKETELEVLISVNRNG